jgi:hypothetical protein
MFNAGLFAGAAARAQPRRCHGRSVLASAPAAARVRHQFFGVVPSKSRMQMEIGKHG